MSDIQSQEHSSFSARERYQHMFHEDINEALVSESNEANPKRAKVAQTFIERASRNFHPNDLFKINANDYYRISFHYLKCGARASFKVLFRACKVRQPDT